ncbi:hypothetical protein SESBI_47266 [Sesbania bispinosa]|nr:hypothetical protein SESBI_47266 [Sesbania bispinosa]
MVQTAGDSSGKLKGTIGNKMVALHDIDPSVHGKKWGLNGLSVQKKQEVENCDSVGKQQKAVSPVCGILKNHSKHVSGKTSSGCNSTQDGTEESHYNDQVLTSDKHVKFSAKDDILGPKKRNSFDETMFNISSDALATSVVKEQSSESDEETASLEANKNYDHIAINKDNDKRKEVCPIVESKQFANTLEQVTVQNFLKPCTNQEKSKHLEEKSELLTKMAVYDNNNLQPFDVGNTTTLHFSPYADISRPLSAVQEEQMSGINTQVCESGAFNSSVKFNDHSEDPSYQVDVNKNANTKTFLDSSSSYSVSYNKANEKPECSLQTYGDNDNSGHALGDRQFSDIFSADMIDNSFPFTNWSKGRVRNGCLDPNYFGLPLNSQGELISFSSSGKVGMNQPETSSTLQGSLPINNILRQSSQENLSPNGKPVVQKAFQKDGLNPFPHHSAGLAVTELQCSEREDIHRPNSDMCPSHYYVQPLNSEFRVQNHNGNGKVSLKEGSDHISLSSSQPTVRLMGKDVPIGRSSQEMQQFSGDVWTDEESRRRHYSEYATLENSLLGRCSNKQNSVSSSHSQISTGNVLQSAKIQSNQGLQNTILMNGRDSGFSHHFIDMQNNHMSQNGSLGVGRASSYFNPITQESTSYGVFNGAPEEFPEQFMPGAKPLGLSSRSHPCNFSQPTYSSNVELNDRNKNPHVTKSAFGFPFLQPSVNEQAKTYWFQRPYRSVPSWLSSSTDEMLPGTFSQQYSGVSNQSFPQNRWGNNFITPSVNHSAEVLFPSNPLTSRGPMTMKTTPLCSASIVQPIRVPVTPSTINSGCSRNINKVPDRVTLDGMITKDHHHPCTNSRKRPAANLDDSRKPIKLSHIEVKENLSRMTRFTGENSRVELQRNTRAVELDPQVDSARSRSCQNEVQRLNPTSYPTVDSFKLDGMVTSGPVRLGPKRAKHILKSS